ncbi:hypothetical protein DICSQDRAFT_172354 [Dichomitus squalens LYAD-421 SS1]|uniref:Uncharacterized protein n=2 Tax=Dichomitus squalens TaxID=114155 RepID=A0A4V2K1U5_9APHY|nr:uncharacterized protein DICSQDRAFT_172354 [Dichomitus squalens LYAD-421 SS1]EJF59034.1 hypothetical protein DICSQDRAFT_172354 [Dichomitus squalens LYAD-421 SS1]TBU34133.1 hypothetical protein BD311DRAFT_650954 [Dichomitus squalens]
MPTLDQLPTIPTLEQLQKMASALRQLRGKVPAGEQLPENTLEKIKKKVLERSASLWTSASQLASEGAEAAAPVVSSVIDRTLRSEEVAKGAEQIGGLMRQVWGSLGTGRR